ncbi:MAG: rhomboid family intramembrane serine protease [Oscillospiraceae bacterium]
MDKFCAKHPRFGIPNLAMYVAIGQVAVGILDLIMRGRLTAAMTFYSPYILRGEVWRLITFILVPSASNPFWLLLGCYVTFWTGQMLEREWGTAKFSLFYLCGVLWSIVGGMVLGSASIYYIHLSFFLVIATMYSEMQVLFMFVVPMKMKWLALLDVALILLDGLQYGLIVVLWAVPSFINYFIFTWPFWSMKLGFARRKADPQVINFKRAQKKAQETGGYMHKCAVCGLTDQDDPNMEFRYCSKCDGYYCYCANHINNHVHIRNS